MYTLESSRERKREGSESRQREKKKSNLIMNTGFSLISLIFSPEKNFEKKKERVRKGERER